MYARAILYILLAVATALPAWAQQPADSTLLRSIHPWANARVAFLGDSQTDPRNDGSTLKYWHFLSRWLGIEPYVYGISGHTWRDIPGQLDRLQRDHGSDFDAITIMVGTNDYNEGIPIGQWYTERDTVVEAAYGQPKQAVHRTYRVPVFSDSTLCGRINTAMDKIKHMYPDKQVVLLTPIHRAFFDGGNRNLQPSEDIRNRGDLYQEPYVQCIKEAANIWAVPVVDTNALTGFYPLINGTVYYHNSSDLLHPNDEGHLRLAHTLYWQLLMLPCRFK